ncbi:glutamate-5-semialdehyde dehydrogenase [Thalassoroseus pseudoceratinae]|uniref:glutamate-5-semialdehyde dehydrogenase n=1 Tax=Thalassoroseus pseudoceratinae TaxID=2713176 RepID=UPI00142496D8|nr:glutamate-5-semialdehyde dehydrogenase [Thalassoroseus pseudoceratinae]
MNDLAEYTAKVAQQARAASRELALVTGEQKAGWLRKSADALRSRTSELLEANEKDIARAPEYGLTSAEIDRLRLSEPRIAGIAEALEQIALLPDPVGEIIEGGVRPNGLMVSRVRVPLGVVFFIYESRPNVTVDAAALCVKSGNAVILRGGKEAFHSNQAFHRLLADTLTACELPTNAVQLVETTDRTAVGHFLKRSEFIDVTIPRGGRGLIERVTAEATMPVIKHYDGNCHVYIDARADLKMAENIVVNAKCQRPGVCNAAETMLVHSRIAAEFLPAAATALRDSGVELRGCPRTCDIVSNCQPATKEDWRTEYLSLTLAVKVVDDLTEAIGHINEFGSHHTDAIVSQDITAIERFSAAVDSSAVVVNASTRFNDGGELGLGAEIGISTDKFHARGPCGLRELTSYKYIVHGNGQIRN